MTPLQKCNSLISKYGHAVAVILADEFIDLFEAMIEKGYETLSGTLEYWKAVKGYIAKS